MDLGETALLYGSLKNRFITSSIKPKKRFCFESKNLFRCYNETVFAKRALGRHNIDQTSVLQSHVYIL